MGVIFLSILVPYFFVFSFVGAALRKRTATQCLSVRQKMFLT